MKCKLSRGKPYFYTIMASMVFIGVYFYIRHFNPSEASEIVMTILAIIAGVAFWLEYHHNSQVHEAEFIVDLNNQFLTDSNLCYVEHILEQYNDLYLRAEQKKNDDEKTKANKEIKEYEIKMEKEIFPLSSENRQKLVNYLVHLEGIATLVNSGVLKLNTINDLMAYRYFIAVNNPTIQKLELEPYKYYYKGIIEINKIWKKKIGDKMPLKSYEWTPDKNPNVSKKRCLCIKRKSGR